MCKDWKFSVAPASHKGWMSKLWKELIDSPAQKKDAAESEREEMYGKLIWYGLPQWTGWPLLYTTAYTCRKACDNDGIVHVTDAGTCAYVIAARVCVLIDGEPSDSF